MLERHFARLRARDELSVEEEQAIRKAIDECRDHPADYVMIKPGVELTHSTLLLDGIVCRYKDLRNGQRQITELHVAGDFADLHSFTLKRLDHTIMSLTPCRVATVPHTRLTEISRHSPHLTRLYWFSTNLDAAIHREWEISLGRRTARAKIAALFCELFIRLEIIGLTDGFSYHLGLTQTDLGDCTGLTNVHVNRTLKELRDSGLVTYQDGKVSILDWDRLAHAGEFDPAYLYLEKRNR
jgi:CRP-like cAMP-binding protein